MIQTEDLLTGVRWKILCELAKKPRSAAQLAEATKSSLPAISGATHLLEAYGYLARKTLTRDGPGKPTQQYALRKHLAQVTLCTAGHAKRTAFTPTPLQVAYLRILLLPAEQQQWLHKLFAQFEHFTQNKNNAIAFVRSAEEETHLLIITPEVEAYRKAYSNMSFTSGKHTQKIVSWSHTATELHEGLQRKETYFHDLFTQATPLFDPSNILGNIEANHD